MPERWPTERWKSGGGRIREGSGCGGRGTEGRRGSRVLLSRMYSKMMHFANAGWATSVFLASGVAAGVGEGLEGNVLLSGWAR